MNHKTVKHSDIIVPKITGAKKGGGKTAPNSLFSTDILFVTNALGEGPIYRTNPNGPQDIEINDSKIDDLLLLDTTGGFDTDNFVALATSGTTIQAPLPFFGDSVITPQAFSSPVKLRKGNIAGVPSSSITLQETSAAPFDSLRFTFIIDELFRADDKGNISPYNVSIQIKIYDSTGSTELATINKSFSDKTDTPYKFSLQYNFDESVKDPNGYRFSVNKTSNDSTDTKIGDSISFAGWDEITYDKQSYPRTAHIGYAIKAKDEHTGGVPNFTSLVKGLIVKVPSNYNQPVLSSGQIDWRQLEIAETGSLGYTTAGYRLQQSGSTVLYDANPVIYTGVWDGTFVYSWTQNPVWIVYDLLTNKTYGLGIAEENIDKYKFYQVAQYCDACNSETGTFTGVDGLSDGTFRNKPRGYRTEIRNLLLGLNNGTPVKERRFIMDIAITENEQVMDILNKLTSTFRAILTYSGGKITMAVDMPEEYPVMLFNDTNIKAGSISFSGVKESESITGIDISYMEPDNHYKREVLRINNDESNDGTESSDYEKISTIDMQGVTRRSQAMRMGQYQLASSKYVKRMVNFDASQDAVYLTPGDLIAVSTSSSGVVYGYGGRVYSNSAIATASDTNVYLEHYTAPSLTDTNFTNNTYPLALRVIRSQDDKIDLYIVDDTDYSLTATDNVQSGYDKARVVVKKKYDPVNRTFTDITQFSSDIAPAVDDLWSFGEIENIDNYYSNKSDKLFKVTDVTRDPKEFIVNISAIEYISNVYVDSDTFINYDPVRYVDVQSPISTPPIPNITLTPALRQTTDGSIIADARITTTTEQENYDHQFSTEYYVAYPTAVRHIDTIEHNTSADYYTVDLSDTTGFEEGDRVTLTGKNGYTSLAGSIGLMCSQKTLSGANKIALTVEGFDICINDNTGNHVLDDYILAGKTPYIDIPIKIADSPSGEKNFIGYFSNFKTFSAEIIEYDNTSNTIFIANTDGSLLSKLPTNYFMVYINQYFSSDITSNCIYVSSTADTHVLEGDITPSSLNSVDLSFSPRTTACISVYVDGQKLESGDFTLNINTGIPSNVQFQALSTDYFYRIESKHFTVPLIEVGDQLQTIYDNVYTVTSSSYDSTAVDYDSALTDNYVYKVYLDKPAQHNFLGYNLVNISPDPVGYISNLTSSTAEFRFNEQVYSNTFNLGNSQAYWLSVGDNYEKVFLSDDQFVYDVPIGNMALKARNKNVIGRSSPTLTKRTFIEQLPIRKVSTDSVLISESLYREQTGGVSVRVTLSFDHIQNQQVTEYEIAYKFEYNDSNTLDYAPELTQYNTIQVSAEGVDSDGKIRFTIPNVNRGDQSLVNKVLFRIVPLNKTIRGIPAYAEKAILGKTAKPLNIKNFTGGQQTDQITIFWEYERTTAGELIDIDLKEIVIYRILGDYSTTSGSALNDLFYTAQPLVTVAAGSQRKSIPIDNYGTYTYLAKTKDTSGQYSDDTVAITISTSRPKRTTVVQAVNEDNPSEDFTELVNLNTDDYYFASYANSVTGGLVEAGATSVDNANGSSSGFSAATDLTDLLAEGATAEYVTQIRDFGNVIHASVSLDIEIDQLVQSTYNDQITTVYEQVSEVSTDPSILVDIGVGTLLQNEIDAAGAGGYDVSNRTLISGSGVGVNTNVWAVWNYGQFVGDTANANSYALIASIVNANAIALGETFFANGVSTGGNSFSNVTTVASSYALVDMLQYGDTGAGDTYQGDLSAVSTQTFIRTSTADTVYYANGNVNVAAFASTVNDGFVPYEAGSRPLRYYQLKYVINNREPSKYDILIDKFRYSLDKEQTVYTTTVSYDSTPKTVDYTNSEFVYRPAISYTVLDQIDAEANPAIAVTTAASNTDVSFKLYASNGSGAYEANSTANVMVTIIGV